jgi:hypothetical protein
VSTEHLALSAKLMIIDQVAGGSLPPQAHVRYAAYRDALIADGQDSEQVLQTLWLFLWNLADGRSVNGVH